MKFVLEVSLTPHSFRRQAVEVPSRALQSNGFRSRWDVIGPHQDTQKPLLSVQALPAVYQACFLSLRTVALVVEIER